MPFIAFSALMDVIAWMAIIVLIDVMAEMTRLGLLSYIIWQKSLKSMK